MDKNLKNLCEFDPKICGIDEAGRGALAGCMAVAACILKCDIKGLNDSKKLTPTKRKELYNQIIQNANFLIIYFSNTQIDELGLSECLRRALNLFKSYFVGYELLYDGNANYGTGIKTMIKADGKVAQVSAASILAKVSRDELMNAWDKIYPQYGYAKHKGYGTKAHIAAIDKFGDCALMRQSFKLKNNEPKLF
ncbi:ribonuclease HII [Campylobacter sp. faydin G-24]|uniref:Ribonuclease n=1 Tax=Campylobacter anatolicus TaxID=2829105 RepID=A0ABS5HIS2_9BACT|nr:ribonuclease HII [Campylobacter anatolicus]MBR8464169.1 ribonuclease HII [Campylobacter anatolicus]